MVRRSTPSARLWAAAAAGLCAALCGSFAGAIVMSKPDNGSSLVNRADGIGWPLRRDGLQTSQTRVDQVNPGLSDGDYKSSERQNKDYGDGEDNGYAPTRNTYGPPRDYYYDEPSDYYRPHQFDGHHQLHGSKGPTNAIYHQQQYPPAHHPEHQLHHYQNYYDDGGYDDHRQHRPGELNVQPLLWPLAGITLLGVLSALVKTPLLLHLGHVSRRRRRRNAVDRPREAITAGTITSLLNKFDGTNQGRRLQQFNSRSCLVCDVVASVYDQKSFCVERSVCEVMSRNEPGGAVTDKRLLSAMIARVVKSDEVPEEFKKRLESAETSGRIGGNCEKLYPCETAAETRPLNERE